MDFNKRRIIVVAYWVCAIICTAALVNIPDDMGTLVLGWPFPLVWTLGWMAIAFGCLTAMHVVLGERDEP